MHTGEMYHQPITSFHNFNTWLIEFVRNIVSRGFNCLGAQIITVDLLDPLIHYHNLEVWKMRFWGSMSKLQVFNHHFTSSSTSPFLRTTTELAASMTSFSWISTAWIRVIAMQEILHQLIWRIHHPLQGLLYMSSGVGFLPSTVSFTMNSWHQSSIWYTPVWS